MARYSDPQKKERVLNIKENTTFSLEVDVIDEEKLPFDLTDYSAVFTTSAGFDKSCSISLNKVILVIEPTDDITQNCRYQIRIFGSDGDVYQILEGNLLVDKAIAPYIANPLLP